MDLKAGLERDLSRFEPPDLWDDAARRAAALEFVELAGPPRRPHQDRQRFVAAVVALVVFVVASFAIWRAFAPTAEIASPHVACGAGSWTTLPTEGLAGTPLVLAAAGSGDVWALLSDASLIHLQAGAWRPVPVPDPHIWELVMAGNDPWVLADDGVWRYDGSTWQRQLSGDLGRGERPIGIAAYGPDDVWVAGVATVDDDRSRAVTLHYDGTRWTRVTLPEVPGVGTRINAFAGTGGGDVWALGVRWQRHTYRLAGESPLALRWNGSGWTRVDASLGRHGQLVSGAALSRTDAWAIASTFFETTRPNGEVIERTRRLLLGWGGSSWTVDDTVSPAGVRQIAVGASGIWLTGARDGPPLQRWDGSTWTTVEPPEHLAVNRGPYVSTLAALDDGVVMVGTRRDGAGLIVRYTCGGGRS